MIKGRLDDSGYTRYRREFLLAMIEFNVSTQEQIDMGISRARQEAAEGREFMPSGAMFAGWCKPSSKDYGIEDFEIAYRKTLSRDWENLHPAFQHVAQTQDMFSIRSKSEKESKKLFKVMYDEVVKRASSGENFKRLVSDEKQTPSGTKPFGRDKGNRALSELIKGL